MSEAEKAVLSAYRLCHRNGRGVVHRRPVSMGDRAEAELDVVWWDKAEDAVINEACHAADNLRDRDGGA